MKRMLLVLGLVGLTTGSVLGGRAILRRLPVAEIHAVRTTRPAGQDPELLVPRPDDWPAWRGPQGNGVGSDQPAPLHWSETQNVLWKTEVPGRGHASPCVSGNRIFLATADADQQLQMLVCLDRPTGKILWQRTIHTGGLDHAHERNTHGSSSAACDGERVLVAFLNRGAIWVTATDLDGKILWQTNAGPYNNDHRYGFGTSPALFQSLVVIAADSQRKGYLAALHRTTGEIVWRVQRPGRGSFSSPVVAHLAGRNQILLSGCGLVTSYDPRTGELLWSCQGPADVTTGTMVWGDDVVFASGGHPQRETICIRADGSGDVSETHIVWRNDEKFYVPSLVYHEGLLYGVNDSGIALCFDAATGATVWKRRLGGAVSASPTIAGEHLYIPNESGTTFVLRTGRQFELVAQNDLGDGGFPSPVICGGQLFLRTDKHLYCIADLSRLAASR